MCLSQVLNENNWKIKEMQTRVFGEIRKGYTHFAEGDVLFAKITPCMENGKAAIARNLVNRIGCGTTELHVIRPHGSVPPEFIYHYIHQESFRKEAEAHMTGTAGQLRVPVDFVASASIPIPPLQEQILIVNRIELLLERTRKAKEYLEKIPPIMKRFRQAALKKAFSGELTAEWREQQQDLEPAAELLKRIKEERESYYQAMARQNQSKKLEKQDNEPLDTSELSELPEGWVWTKIEEIGQVKGGKRLPKGHELLEEKTPYPYIRAGNLKNGTVLTNQIMYVSEGTHKKIERYTISAKDVYITIVGACIGDVGVIPSSLEGANLTENAAKICELKNIDNKYIALAFSSSQIKNQIDENILSAAQIKLALFRIAKLCVPLPSLPEQQEIVRRIESLFKFADETEKNAAEARKRVEIMTQSILARAFRGDLSADFREAVRNWKNLDAEARGKYIFVLPEEEREKVLNGNEFPMEPASGLLERIGEEKGKINKGKIKSKGIK